MRIAVTARWGENKTIANGDKRGISRGNGGGMPLSQQPVPRPSNHASPIKWPCISSALVIGPTHRDDSGAISWRNRRYIVPGLDGLLLSSLSSGSLLAEDDSVRRRPPPPSHEAVVVPSSSQATTTTTRRSDSEAASASEAGVQRCYLPNTSALTTWPCFQPCASREDPSFRILPM